MSSQSRFERRPAKPTLHPRRVVGGVRLQSRTVPPPAPSPTAPAAPGAEPAAAPSSAGWTWASARWMRLAELNASPDQLAEGLEYARAGQTRTLEIKPGHFSGKVQGRMPQSYQTAIRLPTFSHDEWELILAAMSSQAKYAASILSGELPTNIEDLFSPHGLRLFPTEPSDLSLSCNCSVFTGIEPVVAPPIYSSQPMPNPAAPVAPLPPPPPPPPPPKRNPGTPWCKHICCLMYLIGERLAQQPLLLLSLRGMPEADVVERLRQQRAVAGMARSGFGGAVPVYQPHVPSVDTAVAPLADCLLGFWHAPDPDALNALDLTISKPEVSHPLLRRLGPSPFTGMKFPLVGLMATCYDVVSAAAVKTEANGPDVP